MVSAVIRLSILTVCFGAYACPELAWAEGRVFTTIGERSCEDWLKARDEISDTNRGIDKVSEFAWVAGFVTGINQASSGGDLMKNLDMVTVHDWIDRYCETLRHDSVRQAVNAMFAKLRPPSR